MKFDCTEMCGPYMDGILCCECTVREKWEANPHKFNGEMIAQTRSWTGDWDDNGQPIFKRIKRKGVKR